jgi:hypothetical protein
MMKHCLETVPTLFNTDRMVSDYVHEAYRPLACNYFAHQAEKKAPARDRAKEFVRVKSGFDKLKIASASTVEMQDFKVGQHLDVHLEVDLATLLPSDVLVELVVTRGEGAAAETSVVPLVHRGLKAGTVHSFDGGFRVELAGHYQHGLRVRVPGSARHDAKVRGLVLWA